MTDDRKRPSSLVPCAYCAEPTPEPTTHQQDDKWVCFDRPAWDWPTPSSDPSEAVTE